jgi:hypothetical protein
MASPLLACVGRGLGIAILAAVSPWGNGDAARVGYGEPDEGVGTGADSDFLKSFEKAPNMCDDLT